MPTPPEASEAPQGHDLDAACSSALGMSIMSSAPCQRQEHHEAQAPVGEEVVVHGPCGPLDDDDEDGGEDGRAGEQEGGVLLHAPGLDVAQALAAALGGRDPSR